jgi:hypothetical protein
MPLRSLALVVRTLAHSLLHPATPRGGKQAVMPTPLGRRLPHPIRVGQRDLWYQMSLVDTTVKQSLASSAGGTRGRECVRYENESPRGARGG